MKRAISLWNGDCLELMKKIPDKSIDLILTDPPYGTTACKWDNVIPFDLMWEQLNRIIKDNGAIVLFGSEPFSSALRMSNIKNYKYDWIWEKTRKLGFMNAKLKPLNMLESISIFSKGKTSNGNSGNMPYYPQGLVACDRILPGKKKQAHGENNYERKNQPTTYKQSYTNYPANLLRFKNEPKPIHPTQKPVALLEYLIKTYTKENETVLDFTMGSGSTGVACINTNRRFIGIEKDEKYFQIAKDRINKSIKEKKNEKSN